MAGTLPPQARVEFKTIVDELESIEARRNLDDQRRHFLEQRLIQLLGAELPPHERRQCLRVACELKVVVRSWGATAPGVVVDMGAGGVFVITSLKAQVGEVVEVETLKRPGTLLAAMKIRGKVAWHKETRSSGQAGFGVAFPNEALTRTFVIDLLRHRLREK